MKIRAPTGRFLNVRENHSPPPGVLHRCLGGIEALKKLHRHHFFQWHTIPNENGGARPTQAPLGAVLGRAHGDAVNPRARGQTFPRNVPRDRPVSHTATPT